MLADQLPDEVEAAHLCVAYLEKRKGLMTDWAKFCYQNDLQGWIGRINRQ